VTAYNATNEVRFAVVIYGGVSLAIYINGVVQEMWRMVRATAPGPDGEQPLLADGDLTGTEKVYRKIGQILNAPGYDSPQAAFAAMKAGEKLDISTRLVIDILSGTSAGGINAIFLAKALANNQSLQQLERVWVNEGDIDILLNDGGSVEDPLSRQKPPQSLLNSNRMYLKLLDAMDRMDDPQGSGKPPESVGKWKSPLVETLDLFSTTTDIHGIDLPMELADGVVSERRHRNVFHFQYPSEAAHGSDFSHRDNPFLAYAARCTSSFPFAFEPMALCDIFPIVRKRTLHRTAEYCKADTKEWQRFYKDYIKDEPDLPFDKRPFGDGGYLDNKPFTYAVETIMTRHAELPVDRKLIYVEPNPDRMEARPVSEHRPDAVENSLAALISLPRYETIRQDLEKILQRNTELERVSRIISTIKETFNDPQFWDTMDRWSDMDTTAMAKAVGPQYAAYQRLKLSAVTDELSALVARAFEIDPKSGYGKAMRTLAGVWRERHYSGVFENSFLMNFDVAYRVRRLRRVMARMNELSTNPPARVDAVEYRKELRRISKQLREQYERIQELISKAPPASELLPAAIAAAAPGHEEMHMVLEPPENISKYPGLASWAGCRKLGHEGRNSRAAYVLDRMGGDDLLQAVAKSLEARFKPVLMSVAEKVEACLKDDEGLLPARRQARKTAREEYKRFEIYDSNVFPIQYGNDIGEGDTVDVIRISPDDARNLRDIAEAGGNGSKLKGAYLGNFGAFLDQSWRKNDILWGRLDGVERIISALLPGADPDLVLVRKQLVDEAQEAIVLEMLSADRERRLQAAAGEELVSALKSNRTLTPQQEAAIGTILNWRTQLKAYVSEVNTKPDPHLTARSLARATTIVGEMLEEIGDKRELDRRPFRLVTRLGRVFWGFVEISTPRSLLEVLSAYWLQVLYLLAGILVFIGTFGQGDLLRVGLTTAGWVVAAHVIRNSLRRYMRGQRSLLSVVSVTAALAVVGLLMVGAVQLQAVMAVWPEPWQILTAAVAVSGLCAILAGSVINDRAYALRPPKNAALPAAGPVISVSLAKTWDEVASLLGPTTHPNRSLMRQIIQSDNWFVLAYMAMFVALGALIRFVHADPLGLGVIACGVLAGLFDLIENKRVMRRIDGPIDGDPAGPLPAAARFTFLKFAFTIGALACAGIWFAKHGGAGNWIELTGWAAGTPHWVELAAAAFALLACIAGVLGLFSRRLLKFSTLLGAAAMILIVLITAFDRNSFAPPDAKTAASTQR
jgi:patatin-related protein